MKKKKRLKVTYNPGTLFGIDILNMKSELPWQDFDVKCDRSSPLGNPVGLQGDESKRDWACKHYEAWFEANVLAKPKSLAFKELQRLRAIYAKHGRLRIFCWCAPLRCHTLTIKNWLEANK